MSDNQPDPVDLMLEGRMHEAAERYLELYVDAHEEGDRSVGADLVAQLHYCIAGESERVAGDSEGRSPEEVTPEVEEVILREFSRRNLSFDKGLIADDIAIAVQGLLWQRKRAEKSIEAVEQEKEHRWYRE